MSNCNDDLPLNLIRAMRFIMIGKVKLTIGANPKLYILTAPERGNISVSIEEISSLQKNEFIKILQNTVSLTDKGHAYVKKSVNINNPYREQHMDVGTQTYKQGSDYTKLVVNFAESPIALLARRKTANGQPFLSENEFLAGERLRADYTRAQIMPSLGANWEEAVSSGKRGSGRNSNADMSDTTLAARQRVDKALTAVGPELASPLIDVCCYLKGLTQVETERSWPARSAKLMLKTALAALSRHYEPPHKPRKKSILHWGASDYKPSVQRS